MRCLPRTRGCGFTGLTMMASCFGLNPTSTSAPALNLHSSLRVVGLLKICFPSARHDPAFRIGKVHLNFSFRFAVGLLGLLASGIFPLLPHRLPSLFVTRRRVLARVGQDLRPVNGHGHVAHFHHPHSRRHLMRLAPPYGLPVGSLSPLRCGSSTVLNAFSSNSGFSRRNEQIVS